VLEGAFHHGGDAAGRAHADGVGDANVVTADVQQALHDVFHGIERDLALVGAAQRARDGGAHLHAVGLGGLGHGAEAFDGLGDGAVDVALAEGFAGGGKDDHLVGLGGEGTFKAFHIGGEHAVAHARLALDAGHDLGVVGHLRHPLGADVAGDFDLAQARGLQAVHELDLVGGCHGLGFVLQAVTRADIDQGDVGGEGGVAHDVIW
jgi:hypothetical protein